MFCGFWLAVLWGVLGILLCITVIGVPFGAQCFKVAAMSFAPYGKRLRLNVKKHPVANTLWAIFIGWQMAAMYMLFGIACCITIFGISRGLQCFKLMMLAFFPFGAVIER